MPCAAQSTAVVTCHIHLVACSLVRDPERSSELAHLPESPQVDIGPAHNMSRIPWYGMTPSRRVVQTAALQLRESLEAYTQSDLLC